MGEITTMDANEARLHAFVCVHFANTILNKRNLNETTHNTIYLTVNEKYKAVVFRAACFADKTVEKNQEPIPRKIRVGAGLGRRWGGSPPWASEGCP